VGRIIKTGFFITVAVLLGCDMLLFGHTKDMGLYFFFICSVVALLLALLVYGLRKWFIAKRKRREFRSKS
jgi:hypothetical protein